MTGMMYALIIGCFVCLLMLAFAKPLGILLRMLLSSIVGGVALFVCQFFGIGIGLNLATLLTVGILGTPGFFGLLFINFIL